jgi:pyridoxal 5'-phosphate synthase pdxS subunit
LYAEAKRHQAPIELIEYVAANGKLPVPNFSAGGVATPADAALMMAMGAETVFVGSGIFKSHDPARFAKAIVKATTYWKDPAKVMEACDEVGVSEPMRGLDTSKLPAEELMANRGW